MTQINTQTLGDDEALQKAGYKPILFRTLNLFQSFSFGFAEIEILGALFTFTYAFGIAIGGPGDILWSFIIGWALAMLIALCLAEIAAVFPYAGGVYNWTAQLVPKEKAPLACYICGWSNFIANAAADAVIAFSFSQLLNAVLVGSGKKGYNEQQAAGVAILIVFSFSILNILRVDKVGWFTGFASVCEITAIILIIISLLVYAPELNTAKMIFTDFENFTGFKNKAYVVVVGMNAGLCVWSGYDAPAHMAEETTNAASTSARAIVYTILFGGLVGIPLMIVMLLCTVKDEYGYFNVYSGITPNPAVNLLMIICGDNYGVGLACLSLVAVFASGVSSVSATTRIFFALTRDNAVPYSEKLSEIHPVLQNPIYTVILVFLIDALLLLLCLNGDGLTAFYGILNISILGFFSSYCIPIMCKLLYQPESMLNSSASLGKYSTPCGIFVCIYLIYDMIINFFPSMYPVTPQNNNWLVVVAPGYVFLFALNWYFFASKNFKGPKVISDWKAPAPIVANVHATEDGIELGTGYMVSEVQPDQVKI